MWPFGHENTQNAEKLNLKLAMLPDFFRAPEKKNEINPKNGHYAKFTSSSYEQSIVLLDLPF